MARGLPISLGACACRIANAAPKFYAIDSHNVNTEAATNDSLIRFLALERAATASPIAAATRLMQEEEAGNIPEQPGKACR